MSDIITTLHPENDANTNLYPNIKKENIPNSAININKLDNDVLNLINGLNQPKYVTTLPSTNQGLVVYTDGHLYSWNGSQYVDTNIVYQATQIADNSITPEKTTFEKLIDFGSKIFVDNGSISFENITISADDNIISYSCDPIQSVPRVVLFTNAKFSLEAGKTYTLALYGDNLPSTDIGGIYVYNRDTNANIEISSGTRAIPLHGSNGHYITFTSTNNVPNGTLNFLCIANVTFSFNFTLMLSEGVTPNAYVKPVRWIDNGAYTYFNEQNNNFISLNNLLSLKNMYRYLTLTFLGSPNAKNSLILLGSNDLHTFDLLKTKGIYTIDSNISNAEFMRDPAIIQYREYFYITYSISMSGNKIGMCRTKDFNTFETLFDLTITDSNDTNYIGAWSPSWFRENDKLYIIVSGKTSGSIFNTLLLEYNPTNHTLGTGVVLLNQLEGIIDGHLYKYNNTYYIITNSCYRFKSDSLNGEYTLITGKGGLSYTEGEYVIKLDNGKYRIFAQGVMGGGKNTQEMYYIDVEDVEAQLSINDVILCNYTTNANTYAVDNLPSGTLGHYWHWTIFDFNNSNDNNNNFIK